MSARLLAVFATVSIAALFLWPIPTSQRWSITTDSTLLAGKKAYLQLVSASPERIRPNVLLLVADDLGEYDLSFYGSSPIETPNIDALARQGVSFANAYATAAVCAPSRAALLTGRYQNRFGFESQPMQRYVQNLAEYLGFRFLIDTDAMRPFLTRTYPDQDQRLLQGLPLSEITLPEIFQASGYATGIIGKWHLGYGPGNGPSNFGFDYQYGFREAFTLYAEESAPDIVNHHHDLFWEKHIWDMGRSGPSAITRNGAPITEPRYLTDAMVDETKQFITGAGDEPFFAYVPFNAPHTPFQARQQDYDATPEGLDHNHRVYLAMIRRLDWAVGELMHFLEQLGQLENTLIVFTSDNGGAAYTGATDNGPLRGGKFTQFEGGLKVPLLLYWRGHLTTQIVTRPALLTDLFTTLTSILKLPEPADRNYDSENLLATPAANAPRPLFWRSDFNRAVREGHWKLLQNTRDDSLMLIDLDEDPGEQDDVAAQHPAIVHRLLQALDEWESGNRQPLWPRVMNYRYEDDLGHYWFAI